MYWSPFRNKLWHKGEESGHTQKVLRDPHRLRRRRGPAARSSRPAASPAIPAGAAASSRSTSPTALWEAVRTGSERPEGDSQNDRHRSAAPGGGQAPFAERKEASPDFVLRVQPVPQGHRRDLQEGRRGSRRDHHGSQGQGPAARGLGSDRRVVPHPMVLLPISACPIDSVLAEFRRREGVWASTRRKREPPG